MFLQIITFLLNLTNHNYIITKHTIATNEIIISAEVKNTFIKGIVGDPKKYKGIQILK